MKRVLAFSSAVCLAVSAAGCGNKKSSSEKQDAKSKITDISAETVLPENMLSFETVDGLFSFGTSENITQADADDSTNNILGENCQFLFCDKEHDIFIGIMPVTDLHQTAEGFSAGLYAGYDESSEFDNLDGEPLTVGDAPAYRITADHENDYIFTVNTVQFGNGDIFAVISSSPESEREICERETNIILSSVSYSGEPLKTEPETYENSYFSIEISPKWYFRKSTDDFVSVSLNLQDSIDYMMYAFSLGKIDSTDIKAAADEEEEKNGYQNEFSRETTEYLGCKAEHTRFINRIDAYTDTYFFEKDGVVYRAVEVCSKDLTDSYKKDIEEIKSRISFIKRK